VRRPSGRRGFGLASGSRHHALVVIDHPIDRVLAFPPRARAAAQHRPKVGVRREAAHRGNERVAKIAEVDGDGDGTLVGAGVEIVEGIVPVPRARIE
jgi:hypothetical protein